MERRTVRTNVLKELESGESLHTEARGESLFDGAINGGQDGGILQSGGGNLIFGCQFLAVSAPRGLGNKREQEKVRIEGS